MVMNRGDEIIEQRTFNVTITAEGFVHFKFKPDMFVELEDVLESYEIYKSLAEIKKRKVLIEFSKFTSVSNEGLKFSATSDLDSIAEAIVINTLPQRITARFYTKVNTKNHPVQYFSSKNEAINWLKNI